MEKYHSFELFILNKLNERRSRRFDFFMRHLTALGNGGFVWIAVALIFLWLRNYQMTVTMVTALISCAIINNLIIKSLFSRERPCDKFNFDILIKRPYGSSFPSGHTATSFACAMALLSPNVILNMLFFFIASGIAFSRVYLMVHYPSDVLCGAFSGILIGYLSRIIIHGSIVF